MIDENKMKVIIDTECYSNYFLLAARQVCTGKELTVEMHNDGEPSASRATVSAIMKKATTISFNGVNYDLPIIHAFLSGKTNAQIKELSDAIIKTNLPAWQVLKAKNIRIPATWDHIDLIELAPGRASLKIYGGRLNAPKMQDLPIEPDATISHVDAKTLRKYCVNDLDVTQLLFEKLSGQLKLRESMSEQYGMDLRSKSDAQIAGEVLRSEFTKATGKKAYKPDIDADKFRYKDPGLLEFETPALREAFNRILETDFELAGNGSVALPEWLKKEHITVGGVNYQMGIGGLHSVEKSQFIDVEGTNNQLADLDVASYYPNMILQQGLEPQSMRGGFLKAYQNIVTRRLEAKRKGDVTTAGSLKIVANSTFGLMGSKYSPLYSPELLIQTTITGQLALLMLIERMRSAGIDVVSANTDGIVTYCDKSLNPTIEEVAFNWMLDTSYELERTDYLRLASRDVNNYVAVKPDGSSKGKGVFASTGLMKNPDMSIVPKSVAKFIADKTPIEKTIKECEDITQFLTVRRVNGGAIWRDQYLGKAVRFYHSSGIPKDEQIRYKTNSNKVPRSEGTRPLMDLPPYFPVDVDYDYYIEQADELLRGTGYA